MGTYSMTIELSSKNLGECSGNRFNKNKFLSLDNDVRCYYIHRHYGGTH